MGVEVLLNRKPPFEITEKAQPQEKEKKELRAKDIKKQLKSLGPDNVILRLDKCIDIHIKELEQLREYILKKQQLDNIIEEFNSINGISLADTRNMEKENHYLTRKIDFLTRMADCHKEVINEKGGFYLEELLVI